MNFGSPGVPLQARIFGSAAFPAPPITRSVFEFSFLFFRFTTSHLHSTSALPDSGKHADSVIEGDGSSQEQRQRGLRGRGQKIVRRAVDLQVCGLLLQVCGVLCLLENPMKTDGNTRKTIKNHSLGVQRCIGGASGSPG